MKIEPGLIKDILQWCEENLPDDEKSWEASVLVFKGYDSKQIVFHTKLLFDNGYLECIDVSTAGEKDFILENLTLNGYQYLALLKSNAWNIAKSSIRELGVIFAEVAIKAVIDKTLPTLPM